MNKKLALILALLMVVSLFLVSCKGKEEFEPTGTLNGLDADVPQSRYDVSQTPRTGKNADTPLVISTQNLDGKFNPFFASSAYDVDVVGMTQLSLLDYSKDGVPEAGISKNSFAYSYKQEVNSDSSQSVYTFVLKNGLLFSDGKPVTIKDLLFSIYVYCDPYYDGSSTYYTLDIIGLDEYRTQTTTEINAKYSDLAIKIFEAGINEDGTYPEIEGVTAEEQKAYWDNVDEAGVIFTKEIIDYVINNYMGYLPSYLGAFTADEVTANNSLKTAFAMAAWGFGSLLNKFAENENGLYGFIEDEAGTYSLIDGVFTTWTYEDGEYAETEGGYSRVSLVYDEDEEKYYYGEDDDKTEYTDTRYGVSRQKIFRDANGDIYDLTKDIIDANIYWDNIYNEYGDDFTDDGVNYESAGSDFVDILRTVYFRNVARDEMGDQIIETISGIKTGTVACADGKTRDYVEITIKGVDPTAIFKMGVEAVPVHYYTDGFDQSKLNSVGVSINDPTFMEHLKTKNSQPLGAGPYVFKSYEDNVVTYEAFDNFLLGSPKIKNLRIKVLSPGTEMDALKAGEVHYSDPSAEKDIVNSLTEGSGDFAKLSYTLVDFDGYGYIGIQGQAIPEFEVRQALAHVFNTKISAEYYGELASVNNRTMTKVQWAHPGDVDSIYPYDGTGETSKNLFIKAGYVYDEAANIMKYPEGHAQAGQQVAFTLSLPSEADDHPAGGIFLDAKTVLGKIGIVANIDSDDELIDKLGTAFESGLQVWAAAWGNGGVDPDMFQIWYSDPAKNQGTSPARSGLFYLYQNGTEEEKKILKDLNELILSGRSTLDPEERKPIYKQALELSSKIAVEVPTYQRKEMFVYNKEIINASTLLSGDDVTPFQSPLAFIWNVELLG